MNKPALKIYDNSHTLLHLLGAAVLCSEGCLKPCFPQKFVLISKRYESSLCHELKHHRVCCNVIRTTLSAISWLLSLLFQWNRRSRNTKKRTSCIFQSNELKTLPGGLVWRSLASYPRNLERMCLLDGTKHWTSRWHRCYTPRSLNVAVLPTADFPLFFFAMKSLTTLHKSTT